ncbi:hypothetical protein D2V93_15515 [Flagellimonas taeanensis]|jgi:hypothetical protein|uniref:hypothetical protein n=1 Tax=Flavobacteriaceae TaxID=49546 RepID=UPI0009349447|nr:MULTISPECIES: hypothetical protein [Allomuricauda]MDC6383798.1 hypothetical protein [Muricauda sp. SK9]MEE1961811.1 hypothetical protein [Allomuricauda taeanensis]RIV48425.1 hypothetical protein D2V93_15515 [Allomuricauda taeanensis]
MTTKKRHWLWNVLIVLTLALCIFAFVEHYKNWCKIEEGNLKVLSGIYYQKIPLAEIDSVVFVDKLPEMERSNGFSWMAKEKGVFKDSITQTKVYVFVDDLRQQKIKVVHHDSLKLYLNLQDSIETQGIYTILHGELMGRLQESN